MPNSTFLTQLLVHLNDYVIRSRMDTWRWRGRPCQRYCETAFQKGCFTGNRPHTLSNTGYYLVFLKFCIYDRKIDISHSCFSTSLNISEVSHSFLVSICIFSSCQFYYGYHIRMCMFSWTLLIFFHC